MATIKAKKRTVIVEDQIDLESEWEVPHSGSTDEATGRPIFDESPVAGGHFVVHKTDSRTRQRVEVHLNSKGREIDPDTGDKRTPADTIGDEPEEPTGFEDFN